MPSLPGSTKQQFVVLVAAAVVAVFALNDGDGATADKDSTRKPGTHTTTSYPIRFDGKEADSKGSPKKHPRRKPGEKVSYPITFSSGKGR